MSRETISSVMAFNVKVWWWLPHFIFFFVFFNTCLPNHIHTIIQYSHPSPFAEASLNFLIALVLSGEKPPWGAELRFDLGSALQQQASALPTEPRCTLIEPRCT